MAATPKADTRPLSPHLQIWKWHATMAASIMHRMTGVGLYAGAILFTVWIVAAALGPQAFAPVEAVLASGFGQLVLIAFTFAAAYHFASGLRHLIWDGPGLGFSPKVASAWSVFNFVFAALATAGLWAAIHLLK